MSRIEEIEDEIKEAMRARDGERRDALRLILNALKNSEKELQRPLSEDEELQVLQRERKRGVEAAEAFRAGGREEQAEAEERELAILEEFMPEPLSEDEIEEIVDDAIAEVGATSMADLGRVMADVMPQIAGESRRRLTREPDRPREAGLRSAASRPPSRGRVRHARRSDLGDDVVDDLLDLVLGERLGHELLEDLELALLRLRLLLAAARAERLGRFEPLLPLALHDLQLLLLGERPLQLLLGLLERVEDQAQRVAALGVARLHRVFDLVVDFLDQAHAIPQYRRP